MSHTPGPWVLSVDCDEYNILDREATFDSGGVMTGSRPNVIAEAFYVPSVESASDPMSGYATKLANAQLIAAAPDLLEALEELVAECGVDPSPLHGMSYFNAQIGPEAYQAVRAAIAKARGESE